MGKTKRRGACQERANRAGDTEEERGIFTARATEA